MAIELVEKYLPYVDEQFTEESKKGYLTNNDFSFAGAKTVKVYKISTGTMQDYGRIGNGSQGSRYGTVEELEATTQVMTLSKDRSFTFVIDALDADETGGTLKAASALARQVREVVIPEVDTHVIGKMCAGAGLTNEAVDLADNIYDEIFKGGIAMDNENVPEVGRILVVVPNTLLRMKMCKDNTGRYQDMINAVLDPEKRKVGFVGNIDGMDVLKVSANKLPDDFCFMIAHPCATVAPVKLESYKVHQDPPGISGALVEGRICYDAFVLNNKKKAIYYAKNKPAENAPTGDDSEE